VKTKILLDTDIGSDIDDAVCLAYLLANPDCELMGITTVTGEADLRASLASALCIRAGQRQVPIYPGAEHPLLIEQKQPTAPQAAALEKWEHARTFPRGQAVSFLRDTIHAHPHEIVLLTIGPLTNIALLFSQDPDIPGLLKGVVMMGGIFTNRLAGTGPLEWNALIDPHATAIVYRHRAKIHRSIGLDVTCRVTMNAKEVRKRFNAALLKPVLDFSEHFFANSPIMTFHDPLAAACIFDGTICEFQRGRVEVELASPRLQGMTHWTPDPSAGPHEIALEVKPEKFFEHYFGVLEAA
jgi:inosine-uridine nucleoside N-ribohydrolase